jgi:NADPH:quinone reductase-like Zn-dependent oxidoreductase
MVPATMRAAAINRFGGIDEIKLQTLPVPEVGPDEVLLRVQSIGVGVWDQWEREGLFCELFRERYGVEPMFPYVIGFDGAGTVAAVGENVTRFGEGDRVYADRHLNPKGGFYAEYAVVDANYVHPNREARPADRVWSVRGPCGPHVCVGASSRRSPRPRRTLPWQARLNAGLKNSALKVQGKA